MSVHVYVDNRIVEQEGFKCVPYDDGSGHRRTFKGVQVFKTGDRLYLILSDSLDIPIPDVAKEYVEEISCYETIPQMGYREAGIYRFQTAECELTPGESSSINKNCYILKIVAKTLEDIKKIIRLIKTGEIRPDESFENDQGGQTYQQLEEDYQRALEKLARREKFFDAVCKFVASST